MVSLLSPLSLAAVHSALDIPPGAVRAGCMRLFAFLADPQHWSERKPWEMVLRSWGELTAGAVAGLAAVPWQRGYCWGERGRAGAG